MDGVTIGKKCQIYKGCYFGSKPHIISMGDYVKITKGSTFITHDGGVEVLRNRDKELKDIDVFGEIRIGNNVFIGNNCIFLPNSSIGDNVIVAAGSVVTKKIPSNCVIAGVPAKIIKSLDDYKTNVLAKFDKTKNMTYEVKKKYLKKN